MSQLKWEYRTRTLYRDDNSDVLLNNAGAEGWELVTVIAASTMMHCFFKRPVRSQMAIGLSPPPATIGDDRYRGDHDHTDGGPFE